MHMFHSEVSPGVSAAPIGGMAKTKSEPIQLATGQDLTTDHFIPRLCIGALD
jgi:hypothetical protein